MDLYTPVVTPQLPSLSYSDRLVFLGSCFADRVGGLFRRYAFQAEVNTHGVLFNPISISKTIARAIVAPDTPCASLRCQEGLWVSTDYHSALAATTEQEAQQKIATANRLLRDGILRAQWLVVTFGTAWVYYDQKTERIATNCHHFPADHFERKLLSLEQLVEEGRRLIDVLHSLNPQLKVLFTVSPVRHLRDGIMDNSVSKATLLLAVQALTQECSEAYYFPSYELMIDELRDYRFYEADMLQPNQTALQYIWDRLAQSWFSPATHLLQKKIAAYRKMAEHVPYNPLSENYARFLEKKSSLQTEIEAELGRALN